MSDTEALDTLDRVDRERARFRLDAERLESELRDTATALAARRAEEDAARAGFEALRTEERATERRIDELRDKKRSATRILETGAGDPAAAQRQIDRCDALVDEVETELLGLLDRLDAAKRSFDEATARRVRAEQVAGTVGVEMPPRIQDLRARETAAQADVDARLSGLATELRNRYLGLREKGRWPVARVKDGKCDACSMTTPPQTVVDLKRGRLLECHGCRRWLLLPPG